MGMESKFRKSLLIKANNKWGVSRVFRLYVITDTAIQSRFSHMELAEMAIRGGADLIQLRDKKMSTRKLLEMAAAIRGLCRKAEIPFLVNDRVDIALMADAEGVHLGQDDFPISKARKILGAGKIIGGTASTVEQALQLEGEGADYIGFGHIFETKTKVKATSPKGIETLKAVCQTVKIPVFAIGGITPDNARSALDAGASGIAVVSAVCSAPNPEEAVRLFNASEAKFPDSQVGDG